MQFFSSFFFIFLCWFLACDSISIVIELKWENFACAFDVANALTRSKQLNGVCICWAEKKGKYSALARVCIVYTFIHRWCLYERMKSNAGWSPFAISFFVRRFELLHEFLQTKIPYMAYQTLFHAGHNHAILLPTQIQTEWKTHHKVTHMRNSILFSAHQQKKVHLNPTEKNSKGKKNNRTCNSSRLKTFVYEIGLQTRKLFSFSSRLAHLLKTANAL